MWWPTRTLLLLSRSSGAEGEKRRGENRNKLLFLIAWRWVAQSGDESFRDPSRWEIIPIAIEQKKKEKEKKIYMVSHNGEKGNSRVIIHDPESGPCLPRARTPKRPHLLQSHHIAPPLLPPSLTPLPHRSSYNRDTPAMMAPLVPLVLLVLVAFTSAWKDLTDDTLRFLPNPSDADFDIHNGALLSPILIPRVPGTAGSTKVLNHFHDFFRTQLPSWTLSTQNSSDVTPVSNGKKVPFVNFMATRDPPWAKPGEVGRLVLVAHYDSKLTPNDFIGATDSAAPCAMMLHVAQSIDAALTRKWASMVAAGGDGLEDDDDVSRRGVMLLFLDGEEAFHNWSDDDSLYGARYGFSLSQFPQCR